MAEPLILHRGIAVPLLQPNIDTDTIIRIDHYMSNPRTKLGPFAFHVLRNPGGTADPACTLNQPAFQGASILVASENFGCGSSREAAVWALVGMGLRAVIAPSYADIFRQNAVKNGLAPLIVDAAISRRLQQQLLEGAASPEIAIDLGQQILTTPSGEIEAFSIGAFEREQLMSGEDEITSTLKLKDRIEAHQKVWMAEHPWAAIDQNHEIFKQRNSHIDKERHS
jgi:3-isopropylmalate/(R)-2-methylmalate dehydratase small subunit